MIVTHYTPQLRASRRLGRCPTRSGRLGSMNRPRRLLEAAPCRNPSPWSPACPEQQTPSGLAATHGQPGNAAVEPHLCAPPPGWDHGHPRCTPRRKPGAQQLHPPDIEKQIERLGLGILWESRVFDGVVAGSGEQMFQKWRKCVWKWRRRSAAAASSSFSSGDGWKRPSPASVWSAKEKKRENGANKIGLLREKKRENHTSYEAK
ncbi:uncharacterized protein G2W53_027582 [Senna tora]|uniref:Uncharacterized protein n=1 Tax=Senna tora TaxID=362788 RepID=A0A834WGR1_9FABA|nr:uncharacterized protein G2W53_027582 [Senna tora]